MSPKPKTLARRLLRENRKKHRTWRAIANEDFNGKVNNTTLCRFAKSQGEWIPKDTNIQIALGLKHERKPRRQSLFDMSPSKLLWALQHRVPMKGNA